MIARRTFLAGTGAVLLAAPLAAEGQQAKVYRVGFLLQISPAGQGLGSPERLLERFGYVAGRNLVVDARWAEGKAERFPSLAAELVALNPDVIVAETTPGTIAAMRATGTVPIVMVNVTDPVGSGLVASLARPGGNVTGVVDFSLDLSAKRLELLHAVVPLATRIAVLMSDNPVHPRQLKAIEDAAKPLGLGILPTMVRSPEEFEAAFTSMARQKAEALIQLGGLLFSNPPQRDKLVALVAKTRLPTMYQSRWSVDVGG